MRVLSWLSLMVAVATFGCRDNQDRRQGIDPRAEVRAEVDIGASFVVSEGSGEFSLGITQDALDKEFLLQANLIYQNISPEWNGLKSRVVAFTRRGDNLYLLETATGHVLHDDLDQKLLLAEFPIIAETREQIIFDFNKGMSRLFFASDWYGSDYANPSYNDMTWYSLNADISYIDNAKATTENTLQVSQVILWGGDVGAGVKDNLTMEVKYVLAPYAPSEDFVPTESKSFDRTGYFEVSPLLALGGGESKNYATKWNHNQPIRFAISDNTPEDYKDSVREGILYWNKAFGSPTIEVYDAPQGVVAPDFAHNVVQWLSFDHAGYAYADAQMDPRTGEILRAQVFLPSTFAVWGKIAARRLIRKIRNKMNEEGGEHQVLSIKGFQRQPFCQIDFRKAFVESLEKLVQTDAPDSAFMELSKDYVREVTAHEIGHNLGLRHNFAGSTFANYPVAETEEIVKAYVADGTVPEGKIPSSSVMDYHNFVDGAMVGDLVEKSQEALAYDSAVIKTLYLGETFANGDLPLFCTDTHRGQYLDCQAGDSGLSAIDFAKYKLSFAKEDAVYRMIEQAVYNKAPPSGFSSVEVSDFDYAADYLAMDMLLPQLNVLTALSSNAKSLRVWRAVDTVTSLNIDDLQESTLDLVIQDIERNGGIESFLETLTLQTTTDSLALFSSLIQSPAYREGVGANDQPYTFSDDEVQTLIEKAQIVFAKLPKSLVEMQQAIFSATTDLVDHEIAEKVAAIFKANAQSVLEAVDGHDSYDLEFPTETGSEIRTVLLPRFTYDVPTRVAALSLFTSNRGNSSEWGVLELAELKQSYLNLVDTALTSSVASASAVSYPRPVARWLLDQQIVLNSAVRF